MTKLTYNPGVFSVQDEDAAKRIILTPQAGLTTEERWERETPYLAGLANVQLELTADSLVLDYGCGIGRMARALHALVGCSVLGADISAPMRALAAAHVETAAFSAISRRLLQRLVTGGLQVDSAFTVWVLQHCVNPAEDIELLASALGRGGKLLVVNNIGRAVPAVEAAWSTDGLDIRALLSERFDSEADGSLDPQIVGQQVADNAFWATYRRR